MLCSACIVQFCVLVLMVCILIQIYLLLGHCGWLAPRLIHQGLQSSLHALVVVAPYTVLWHPRPNTKIGGMEVGSPKQLYLHKLWGAAILATLALGSAGGKPPHPKDNSSRSRKREGGTHKHLGMQVCSMDGGPDQRVIPNRSLTTPHNLYNMRRASTPFGM